MTAVEVAAGVWRAGTRFVNWYLVDAGGEGLTVVDAGLPAYVKDLGPVLRQLGRTRQDIRALVLTHGHIDHIGMAAALAQTGTPVHLHPADRQLAQNPRSNKTDRPLLPYLRYPATLGFIAHCLRQGALRPSPMPDVQPLHEGTALAVPGRPMVTHAPGHTDGSCVLEFQDHGVVFVGDLLCTVSPITGRDAPPQLQTRGSNRNSGQALSSLQRLNGIDARIVLAGHGNPWRDGVEAATASAQRIGCR